MDQYLEYNWCKCGLICVAVTQIKRENYKKDKFSSAKTVIYKIPNNDS